MLMTDTADIFRTVQLSPAAQSEKLRRLALSHLFIGVADPRRQY